MNADPWTAAHLRLTVRFADTAVVSVIGELDAASAPELEAVLDAVVDRGHVRITVECSELTFIDATGLGTLTRVLGRLDPFDGELRVQGLPSRAYRIFEITGLIDTLHAERQPEGFYCAGDEGDRVGVALQASRLAAESARSDELSALLARITTLAPKVLSNCDGASVTLRRGEHLVTAAASDDTVRHLDSVQYATLGGPCVDATWQGVKTHSPALVEEQRWRPFTTRARERGMESVLSTPLAVGDQPPGALNLYARTPHAFSAADQELASVFADLTAILLLPPDETAFHQFDDRIRDAFASRDVIAQAQGILMERLGVHAQDAYATLRRDSVNTSIPLRTRAGEIIDETQDREGARGAEGQANA